MQENENTQSDIPYLSPKRKLNRKKAIDRGFEDEYHMEGWLYFNRIDNSTYTGYEVDVFHFADGETGE